MNDRNDLFGSTFLALQKGFCAYNSQSSQHRSIGTWLDNHSCNMLFFFLIH